VTLGVQEDEVLGLVHELEQQIKLTQPVIASSNFGVGSEAVD